MPNENGNAYYDWGCLNRNHWALGRHVDRLAAYEDSGLSPEEVQKLKMLLELRTEERDQLSHDVDMAYMNCEKLCEELEQYEQLAQAKADGRLVEVVRCGECRHYNTTGCSDGCGWCENMDRGVFDEHYCSRGERREKE